MVGSGVAHHLHQLAHGAPIARGHGDAERTLKLEQLATLGKRGQQALSKLVANAGTDPLKARFAALAQSAKR